MDYGAIINAGPPTVRSLGVVTLQVSPAHGFKFLRGQTYVTYRAPSATAQLTVRPEGVQHIDDYTVRAHVPDMTPGTYECLVTSGADLARTAAPLRHIGAGSGPSAPRDYGLALDAPQPQSAYEGDTVSIRALPGTGFEFAAEANFLTFGAPGGSARFTLQPGGIRRAASDEIHFELPAIPPGTYAIWARSAGNDAQTRMPIRHLGGRPFGQSASSGGQPAGRAGGRLLVPAMGGVTGPRRMLPGAGVLGVPHSPPTPGVTRPASVFAARPVPTVVGARATRGQRPPVAGLTKRTLGIPTISRVNDKLIKKLPSGTILPAGAVGTTPFGSQNTAPSHDFAGIPPEDAFPDSFDTPAAVEPEEPIGPNPGDPVPDFGDVVSGQPSPTPRDAFPTPPNPYSEP